MWGARTAGAAGANSPIAGFLAKSPGGGMHHPCFEVPDIAAAVATLVAGGARALELERE